MKLSDLNRGTLEADIKKAYDLGLCAIEELAERTERRVEEVLGMVFVDGEDGAVVEARELAAEATAAPATDAKK